VTNRPNGTLYAGVTTADIARRAMSIAKVSARDVAAAIQRERNMKHWPRARKVRPILAMDPEWRDLYLDLTMTRLASRGWPGQARP
jgi:putative endonuclease